MPTIWWLDALKRIEKIMRGNAFEQKKKKHGLRINSGPMRGGVGGGGGGVDTIEGGFFEKGA